MLITSLCNCGNVSYVSFISNIYRYYPVCMSAIVGNGLTTFHVCSISHSQAIFGYDTDMKGLFVYYLIPDMGCNMAAVGLLMFTSAVSFTDFRHTRDKLLPRLTPSGTCRCSSISGYTKV
jgi:hypothetical protein